MTAYHRSPEWARFVRKARPIIAATLPAPCVQPRCQRGGTVHPEEQWDVAHLPGHDARLGGELSLEVVGAAHRRCNRSDGGRTGNAIQQQRRKTEKGYPTWW